MCGSAPDPGKKIAQEMRRQEAARQARVTEIVGLLNNSMAGRGALYDDHRQNVYDLGMRELDPIREQQERQIRFQMARQGLIGGSADVDAQQGGARAYQKSLADLSTRANAAERDFMLDDENKRLSTISLVQAGADPYTASQQAYADLAFNAQNQSAENYLTGLGLAMNNYGMAITNQALKRGAAAPVGYTPSEYGSFVGSPLSSRGGGTIVGTR